MLKRLFLILSLLATSATVAFSQFHIGANLGAGVSATNLNPAGREVSSLVGVYPEVYAGYDFNKNLSANLGLGYMQGGFKEQPFGDGERTVRLRYFRMPVYADLHFPFCQKLSAGALAGLQFNVFNSLDAPAPFNIDFQQMHHPVSLLLGVQCAYNICPNMQLHLQYRYVSDFAYADDNEVLGRLHGNNFLVGVSYVLGKSKTVGE